MIAAAAYSFKPLPGKGCVAFQWFGLVRDAFDVLYREGATAPKMMSVGLHQRLIGHPGRMAGLWRFLDHVQKHSGVWVTGRLDIAKHWIATHPYAGKGLIVLPSAAITGPSSGRMNCLGAGP